MRKLPASRCHVSGEHLALKIRSVDKPVRLQQKDAFVATVALEWIGKTLAAALIVSALIATPEL